MRILIVEDHPDSAYVLSRTLRDKGHEVLAAADAQQALAAIEQQAFDLMIADIGLPDCDGWELLARVRQRQALRAIALTGYGMPVDIDKSRTAGFDAHLTKPVRFETLHATVEKVAASS